MVLEMWLSFLWRELLSEPCPLFKLDSDTQSQSGRLVASISMHEWTRLNLDTS
jgi:hypothetical protein